MNIKINIIIFILIKHIVDGSIKINTKAKAKGEAGARLWFEYWMLNTWKKEQNPMRFRQKIVVHVESVQKFLISRPFINDEEVFLCLFFLSPQVWNNWKYLGHTILMPSAITPTAANSSSEWNRLRTKKKYFVLNT